MSNNTPLNILLVKDDPADTRLIQEMLREGMHDPYTCTCAFTIGEAFEQLREATFDVILLDLHFPDGPGLEVFRNMHAQARRTPILLLAGQDDHILALQALGAGAQDCLLQKEITGSSLERAIRFAIERQRLQTELHNLLLTDSLTGLYNQRGFLILANEQRKLLHRSAQGLLLFLFDVDRMKAINDTFGHSRGDQILIDAAILLRNTFRSSDIIARLESDEFGILAIGTLPSTSELLQARLQANLNRFNAQSRRPHQLMFSSGISYAAPESQTTLEEMLSKAEGEMNEQKQAQRGARSA